MVHFIEGFGKIKINYIDSCHIECVPQAITSSSATPASDILLNESAVTNEVSSDESDLDPVRILASLCANAPDYEVRDCLRKYSLEFSLKRQKVLSMQSQSPSS